MLNTLTAVETNVLGEEIGVEQGRSAKFEVPSKEATKANQFKSSFVLIVLLIGSFVVPFVQYYWYVKDDVN
ncbi:unnamed protein product [Vitrella brassicaformis CCMP3155]|uniref:Uncharacterized protein n=1 Tax=Vitrella brassicaformis (strain CCMP3155) TaxID=1169540 RepID=A0A0G4FEU4_VITBC|nr:unnamed protein product [Vitrella brassicaformis CCMP3155]|eukprot:CEM11522.1 unnamed protein product [Vitrella brassicaformis CCMP3155]